MLVGCPLHLGTVSKLGEVMDCYSQSLKAFSRDRFGCLAVLNGSSDRADLIYSRQQRVLVVNIALMRSPRLNAKRGIDDFQYQRPFRSIIP